MDEQSLQQPLDEVERVTHAGETGRSAEAGVSFSTAHTDATLVYWKISYKVAMDDMYWALNHFMWDCYFSKGLQIQITHV